ncbi:MAG: PTS transporter subunit EIIC [Acidobacteriota bacterium]|nr:PTS transporter subunit EIIC [Acidobacteriota bacterium]
MANAMDTMTEWMNSKVGPMATHLSENKYLKAISGGMMQSMPLTLGVALIAIIINLPIPGVSDFLQSSGLAQCGTELIGSTMSLLGIYISWLIAYQYAKEDGTNPITAAVLSMASFLALVPSTVTVSEDSTISAYMSNYLGSDGIFVAIVFSIFVASFYGFLTRKNIKLTLPDSVPPMVTDSLSPVFSAMIIFGVIFLIKWGFTFTQWGNVFSFVSQIIAAPLVGVSSSPWTNLIVFTACNLIWFFGVHPNSILSVVYPVIIAVNIENQAAYLAGDPMPHAMFGLVGLCCYFGGTGNTIGLCLDMFTARSEKFKAMRSLMTIPNIFNINEPVIFGVPVMLNPIFFIPMLFASIVPGLIGMALCSVLPISYNPTISLPFAMPSFVNALIVGGPMYMVVLLICMASSALLYYPFFKIADNQAYEEEQALAAAHAAE